jgi:putative ABC transport system ATP-binding protein
MTLKLENVTKSYRKGGVEISAVDAVSLSIQPGEFASVTGASGCGKTTLLLLAGGLLHPSSGRVNLCDIEPYTLSSNARARFRAEHIGFVFQQFCLIPYLDVRENIVSASLAVRHPNAERRADELMEQFNLGKRAKHLSEELSTGERQRTALARAMLNNPKVLLADEPTGNLDDANAEVVLKALASFAGSGGSVLLVTHDARAAGYADTTHRMRDGKLLVN